MELKKSYKGLIIMGVILLAVVFTVIMAFAEHFAMKDLFWIDMIVCWGGICVIAIGTVKVKL